MNKWYGAAIVYLFAVVVNLAAFVRIVARWPLVSAGCALVSGAIVAYAMWRATE
mgnify:CR=1 FL=1